MDARRKRRGQKQSGGHEQCSYDHGGLRHAGHGAARLSAQDALHLETPGPAISSSMPTHPCGRGPSSNSALAEVCRGRVAWRAVKRRLFTILSALSLLLCVAVCVLWVRSYFR